MAKLSDSEGESAETQTWLDFAFDCGLISEDDKEELNDLYDKIIGKLVNMSIQPEKWAW